MRSHIIGFCEEPDGSCTIGFWFISTIKQFRPDNPEFDRVKETLLTATMTRQDVFYTQVAGRESVLDDVALAS